MVDPADPNDKNEDNNRTDLYTGDEIKLANYALKKRAVIEIVSLNPPQMATTTSPVTPFQILRTAELDEYERVSSFEVIVESQRIPSGDNYTGTARKAAKITIADAEMEEFDDLKDLIESLTPDDEMINHHPQILDTAQSGRVEKENRNVRVRAFLYAAAKENDNDFHLIIGRAPDTQPKIYMTVEISGLSPADSDAFKKLSDARAAFKGYFGSQTPGKGYDHYNPPRPVLVEGSLFFDITHAHGSHPGPSALRPNIPTIWEIHPVSKIVF